MAICDIFDLNDPDHVSHFGGWHTPEPAMGSAIVWSLVAAHADNFCYSYDYLIRFLRERNQTCGWGGDPNYFAAAALPDALQFLEILEFRESELLRAASTPGAEWQWPADWGQVGWSGPIVDQLWGENGRLNLAPADVCHIRLLETRKAIAVHKSLMGHGFPVPWAEGLADLQTTVLFRLFFSSALFQARGQQKEYATRNSLRVPAIRASLDLPNALISRGNQDSLLQYDTCGVLGLYHPFAKCYDPWFFPRREQSEIWIHERAIQRCSSSVGVEREALSRVVLAHELSHWLVHRFADAPGAEWQREPYEWTRADVRESWAQLLALWMLTDLEDKPALAAFVELSKHQSSTYRAFERVLATTNDRQRILATLPSLRTQHKGASMGDWLALL